MRFKFFIVLLLAIFISGCSSTGIQQDPKVLSVNHGYVSVHFPRIQPYLELRSVKTKKKYDLAFKKERVAGLWLPEGTYKLTRAYFAGMHQKLPTFPEIIVEKGRVTDLGSLVNFSLGEDQVVWVQIDNPERKDILKDSTKGFASHLLNPIPISWNMDKVSESTSTNLNSSGQGLIVDMILSYTQSNQEGSLKTKLKNIKNLKEFYQQAKKTLPPFALQEPAEDDQGNLYYGAELGQIKMRSPDGVWSTIDTGTLDNVSKVVWSKGIIYSGGISKSLLKSNDSGQSWSQIFTLGDSELLLDLDITNEHIYVLTNRPSQESIADGKGFVVSIYRSSLNGEPKFEVIKNIANEGFRIRSAKAEISGNKYLVGFEPNVLTYFDLKTEQWIDKKAPQKFSTFNTTDKGLITLFNIQGAFSDLFISNDFGNNWSEMKTPSYIIEDIYFTDSDTGIAQRIEPNAFSVSLFTQRYDAKKKKWVNISEAPEECKYFVQNKQKVPQFCVTKSDNILSFKENSWSKEVIK